MFAGVSNDALLIAGGANFPSAPPWKGGTKVFYEDVHVLERSSKQWKEVGKLPKPIAYGASVTTDKGVVCIGGNDSDTCSPLVFLLEWNGVELRRTDLPPLPTPVTAMCAASVGDAIYVAGGTTSIDPLASAPLNSFWCLKLSEINKGWKSLPTWPGVGRFNAVSAALDGCFYLLSGMGREPAAVASSNFKITYLSDAYRYNPSGSTTFGRWSRIADLPAPRAAVPSPAPAIGASHFIVLGGGADGSAAELPMEQTPGFTRDCLLYDSVTNTWVQSGFTPGPRVTTPAVQWGDGIVIPSGEQRPGVRSPEVWSFTATTTKAGFGVVNYATLVLYLLAMVGIGVYCSRRNNTTDDFFRGGQRIPWWAAGLSIFATMLSSITFMAVPALSYASGWNLFLAPSYLLLTPLVICFYLPFFRHLNITSAYEYLERRFNLSVRLFASFLFLLFQLGRISIVLYLPALALATVSSVDLYLCILLMGLLCIVYTVMGGMEAVIWTDVVQAIVLMGGAILSIVLIAMRVDGGFSGIFRTAAANGKFFQDLNWQWDHTQATALVVLIGCFFVDLLPYTASQDVVQRYVTTKDEKTAARALWTNLWITIPVSALFFAIGTALWAFYRSHPDRLDPTLPGDAIFPQFIVREIPTGLAGLVVAGIFAAAQSTLASSMNSVATAYVTDFHKRFRPSAGDADNLRVAKRVTVWIGVIGTIVAVIIARYEVRSLYLAFLEILSLLGGTLSGLFVAGIFTRRITGQGAMVGAISGTAITLCTKFFTDTNFYLFGMIGVCTCVGVGALASFFVPDRLRPRRLDGLTIYTRVRSDPMPEGEAVAQ
jgi:SSS family transporter